MREMELKSVVDDAIRLASFDSAFQQLELTRQDADDVPQVLADADQLQQVVLNLRLNARDAMPNGGSVAVATFCTEAGVCISVEDSGPGLDESVRKQLFDPFFTTKPAGKGTGLGLAVCYGIVTAHNGRIDVNSSNGNGTKFTVILPL